MLLEPLNGHHEPCWAAVGVRIFEISGCGIHRGTRGGHSGASGEVARAVLVPRSQLHRLNCVGIELGDGRLRLAGKALEALHAPRYPPSSIPTETEAKFSLGSEKMASWLSGYSRGVDARRRLHGCSAELAIRYGQPQFITEDICYSHSGGPGEPRGVTRDPRGRPPRRPDGPDGVGRARRHIPGREKG